MRADRQSRPSDQSSSPHLYRLPGRRPEAPPCSKRGVLRAARIAPGISQGVIVASHVGQMPMRGPPEGRGLWLHTASLSLLGGRARSDPRRRKPAVAGFPNSGSGWIRTNVGLRQRVLQPVGVGRRCAPSGCRLRLDARQRDRTPRCLAMGCRGRPEVRSCSAVVRGEPPKEGR